MNTYKIELGNDKNVLNALGLSAIAGNELDFRVGVDGKGAEIMVAFAELPFSLSNLESSKIRQLVSSSNHQQVIENLDLPIVSKGDLVVCSYAKTERQLVAKFYDSFSEIGYTDGSKNMVIGIGISNSTKTDILNPFDGVNYVVLDVEKGLKINV
jgi:hypothetical protein